MNILYIILFSILYVIVIVGLKYLAMAITNLENTIKCPKCGSNMDYIYSDNEDTVLNYLKSFNDIFDDYNKWCLEQR